LFLSRKWRWERYPCCHGRLRFVRGRGQKIGLIKEPAGARKYVKFEL
jgi:hypothetical protein